MSLSWQTVQFPSSDRLDGTKAHQPRFDPNRVEAAQDVIVGKELVVSPTAGGNDCQRGAVVDARGVPAVTVPAS